ncbi:MAG TPA: radical SAM protein [Candidatus Saccharimonadia bacterium]|nr:radical SAM protein [Candidatus Saccharimonadia bacterium]
MNYNLYNPVYIPELMSPPTRAMPIREYAIEVQGSCDMGCPDCYMYQGENASNRKRYLPVELGTIALLGQRITEHAAEFADETDPRYQLKNVTFILHGGEPLLNIGHIEKIVQILRQTIPDEISSEFVVQTNATTLSEEQLAILARLGVGIGVSIDGLPEDHDRSRPLLNGTPSYERVAKNTRLLRDTHPDLFRGILCTLNQYNMGPPSDEITARYGGRTKAVATFKSLEEFRPDPVKYPNFKFDFIWPHATWNTPPPNWDPSGVKTPYADYMIELFDYLFKEQAIPYTRIRFFDAIIKGIRNRLGSHHVPVGGEIFGFGDAGYLFIEADGQIKGTDGLKALDPGADSIVLGKRTGNARLQTNKISDVLEHPLIKLRRTGAQALGETCLRCLENDVGDICGGGRFSDRQKDGTFMNPSVYCDDIKKLIGHIIGAVSTIL